MKKYIPLVLLGFLTTALAAWCSIVPLLTVPSLIQPGSLSTSANWNATVPGVYTWLNTYVVAPMNVLVTKGDIYGCDGSALRELSANADGTVLMADSTQPAGLNWVTFTGDLKVTTKGDIETFDGTTTQRTAVGGNGTFLTADSAQSVGVGWETSTALNYPTGAVVPWSPSKAGTNNIPAGWLLCDGTSGTPNLIGMFVAGGRPNGSSATPSAGGFGAEAVDNLGTGNKTHTHSVVMEDDVSGTDSTSVTVKSSGNITLQGGAVHGHYHTFFGTLTSQASSLEPADYVLVYICKQ